MTARLLTLISITFFLCQCNTQKSLDLPSNGLSTDMSPKFYVEHNEGFRAIDIPKDERPQPTIGQKQMTMDMYKMMKYPASARQKGTQGIVILCATVKPSGLVSEVNIVQSVSPDLDDAALNAYKIASEQGYVPFYYEGEYKAFKMEIPIRFSL